MAACRSSFRIYTKNELKNKTSPWAHVESELDMLGVPGKPDDIPVSFKTIRQALHSLEHQDGLRG
jgi:hypothetical protein